MDGLKTVPSTALQMSPHAKRSAQDNDSGCFTGMPHVVYPTALALRMELSPWDNEYAVGNACVTFVLVLPIGKFAYAEHALV
jgi:hypothetical protein